MSDEFFFEERPGNFDAAEASIQSNKAPLRPSVVLCLKADNGTVIRGDFHGDLLQLLHKACMDALGMHYQTFEITGIKYPEPGAST